MTKCLVIGTAPAELVHAVVGELSGKQCVVIAKNCGAYSAGATSVYELKKKITTLSLDLFGILMRHRPDEIYLVTGKQFWHDNVLVALRRFDTLLCLQPRIFIVQNGVRREHSPFPLYFSVRTHFAVYLLLAMALMIGLLTTVGRIVVATAILAEAAGALVRGLRKPASGPRGTQYRYSDNFMLYDKVLGWKLRENIHIYGDIHNESTGEHHDFSYTHDERGNRVARQSTKHGKIKVAFAGCSYTYGAYLLDEETYPFIVQCADSELEVRNYGVGGYSLLQMYLSLKESFERFKPEAVVLGFHSGLVFRTVTNYQQMKRAFPAWPEKKPSLDIKRRKVLKPKGYCRVAGAQGSMIVHLVECALNFLNLHTPNAKTKGWEHTKYLLLAIKDLCERNGAKLLVVYHPGADEYVDFIRSHFNWCISIPTEEYFSTPEYRIPMDGHPSYAANLRFAEAVGRSLKTLLETGRCSPPVEEYYACLKPGPDRGEGMEGTFYPLY